MSKHKLFLVQVAQSHPQIQFKATDSHRVWIKVTIAYVINQPTYKSYMLLITGNIYIYIYIDYKKYYLLVLASGTFFKSFSLAAGIMSMLAIISPCFSLIATAPLVFLPCVRIYVQQEGKIYIKMSDKGHIILICDANDL